MEITIHYMENSRHISHLSPTWTGPETASTFSQIVAHMNCFFSTSKNSAKWPAAPPNSETKNGPLIHANLDGGFKASSLQTPVETTSTASSETTPRISSLQEMIGDSSTCTAIPIRKEPNAKPTEATQAMSSESCSIKLILTCTQSEATIRPSWNGKFVDLWFPIDWL